MASFTRCAKVSAVLALAISAAAGKAHAVPLPPGGAVATPGTTAAAQPVLNGVAIAVVNRPFAMAIGPNAIKGYMQDVVMRENATGTLDFYYRIVVYPGSNGAIVQVARKSFAPAAAWTDVNWRIDWAGLKPPKGASRTIAGDVVTFNHLGGNSISAGQMSRAGFIRTPAKKFMMGGAGLQWLYAGGGITIPLPAFQPAY